MQREQSKLPGRRALRRHHVRRDFREAVSAIEGGEVIFGPERFDLREILAAIHRIGESVAPTMDEG